MHRLEYITLHDLVGVTSFQAELFSTLEELAPVQLAEAKKSAGNIHNPKVVELGNWFPQAVLATNEIKAISEGLAEYGLKVQNAEFEKLMFLGQGNEKKISCMLWLDVTPVVN